MTALVVLAPVALLVAGPDVAMVVSAVADWVRPYRYRGRHRR
jgi:hypothetical protein